MVGDDDDCRTEVLIIGGGPVGMLLALFLDRYGVKSVVFNTEDGVPTHPRGSTHNSRTMEHYRRLSISGPIRKLGLPPIIPRTRPISRGSRVGKSLATVCRRKSSWSVCAP